MLMPHEGQGEKWDAAFSQTNIAFTGIFLMEMLLRWMAMGLPQYFSDGWCRFDCVVVVVSIIGVLMDYLSTSDTTILPILRALRVLRIFKLVPRLKSLRQMLLTIMYALPALFNVAMVLFLFLYLYSIIGLNLFGNLMLQTTLNQNVNFQTFTSSMLLLFRSMTGENWNAVMADMQVQTGCILVTQNLNVVAADNSTLQLWSGQYLDPYGDQSLISQLPTSATENQCSISPTLAAFYYTTFMLVCTFLILQLVIGIIIESIELQYANDRLPIHEIHINSFVDTWNSIDIQGTNFIDAVLLTTVLSNVPHPMGVQGLKGKYKSSKLAELIYDCDIPMRDGRINFLETLMALAYKVAGADIPEEDNENLVKKIEELLNHEQNLPPARYRVAHLYSALFVKANIQGFLVRLSLRPIFARYVEYEKNLNALRLEARSNRRLAGTHGVSQSIRRIISSSPQASTIKRGSGRLSPLLNDSAKTKAPTHEIEEIDPLVETAEESKKRSLFSQISQKADGVNGHSRASAIPIVGQLQRRTYEHWNQEDSQVGSQVGSTVETESTLIGDESGRKGRRLKLPPLSSAKNTSRFKIELSLKDMTSKAPSPTAAAAPAAPSSSLMQSLELLSVPLAQLSSTPPPKR